MTDSPQPPFIRRSDGSISEGRSVLPQPGVLDRLNSRDLSFVRVDHQTRLQFGGLEVVIETPFHVTAPDGTEYSLDPGLRAGLGPVLGLYPDALVTATVDAAASLGLRFASGATLEVPPDPAFEAWQVNGPDGFLVVCATGGSRLAVWSGADE